MSRCSCSDRTKTRKCTGTVRRTKPPDPLHRLAVEHRCTSCGDDSGIADGYRCACDICVNCGGVASMKFYFP